MNPLTLNKVSKEDKKILVECLEFYINDIHHIRMKELEKLLETIAQRLYYRWLGLINKPTVPKQSTLKLPYDEGYVLQMAVMRYQNTGNVNDLDFSVLERFKFQLNRQLI